MRLPRDVHPASLSRLPLLERGELDEEGQKHYDAVVSPASRTLVGLRGPSGIWLHSPKLAGFLRAANQYLRFETALDRRLTPHEAATRLRSRRRTPSERLRALPDIRSKTSTPA